jgi:hypothetical protein
MAFSKTILNNITMLWILLLFCIQWSSIYRRMERYFSTSYKCEWEAFVGTSHPFQWGYGGDPFHPISGWGLNKIINALFLYPYGFSNYHSCILHVVNHVMPCGCVRASFVEYVWNFKTILYSFVGIFPNWKWSFHNYW